MKKTNASRFLKKKGDTMLIMPPTTKLTNQVWDYPPYPYLEQVLSHCPKAGCTYLYLWKHRDSNNYLQIERDKIPSSTLFSTASFLHNLRLLASEGLISFIEKGNRLKIELVGWDIFDEI
jgi:hypothetical protein